jgi:hypothetical protein
MAYVQLDYAARFRPLTTKRITEALADDVSLVVFEQYIQSRAISRCLNRVLRSH